MKITFIQPRGRGIYSVCPEPPLGLAYLASSILKYKNDSQIEIIDGYILDQKEYLKKISDVDADVAGITVTMSLLNEALRIPRLVMEGRSKRDDNYKIDTKFIIGGPGVSNIPSSKLYESGYSIVCYGEGENTIVDLMKAFEGKQSLDEVRGISYLSNRGEVKTPPRERIENLDDLPVPARDLLDMEKYIGTWKEKMGIALTHIVSSRGCQFSCRFCDKAVYGKKTKFHSPARLIEEMRELYGKYKAEMVFFEEDLFTLNRGRVLEFCRAMEEELPRRRWGAYSRVDTVDLDMLSGMKRAGCTDLVFGVESGSQRILDFLGKGITVDGIRRAFGWAKQVGIDAGMFLIVGVPGETREDIDLTKRLIVDLEPNMINLSFLTPIPGTEIYNMTKHLIKGDIDYYDFDDLFGGVYKKEAFGVDPKASYHDIMNFFLETFRGRVDPRLSLYDGTVFHDQNSKLIEQDAGPRARKASG